MANLDKSCKGKLAEQIFTINFHLDTEIFMFKIPSVPIPHISASWTIIIFSNLCPRNYDSIPLGKTGPFKFTVLRQISLQLGAVSKNTSV